MAFDGCLRRGKRIKMNIEDFKIQIIEEKNNLNDFYSYEKELVDFLREDAFQNQHLNLSVTFLWFYEEKLVSYVTLLNDRITLDGDLQNFFKNKGVLYKSLPALKIGRLCVDDAFRKKGFGTAMVKFAIKIAKEISLEKAGCRFLTVDAKRNKKTDQDSYSFYTKLGFESLRLEKEQMNTPMYLDLKLIE